ncbi:MAG: hypothetical protein SFT94_09010 [Pseudanabaenaceae cyanobacterium bins.68]|nr:hypothetical protein [Pseudanabaenaceae cyanobacterium bins.68]
MSYLPPDLEPIDYLVVGVATCFIKVEGGVKPVRVLEPIASASLEALLKQIPTSYDLACAVTLAQVLDPDCQAKLPDQVADLQPDLQIADQFAERAIAAARTYKAKPIAQTHIPLGETYQGFNFSLDKKRLLNSDRIVSEADNVKQHSHTHKVL